MIKIENTEVVGWEHAIRGARNPMNSWDRSDSHRGSWIEEHTDFVVGENDLILMKNLAKAGTDHSKYLRMLVVYCDIVAPRYWWTEFDTYKVGTVRNSCSTMHKIHSKEFDRGDFSCEHLPKGSEAYSDTWDFETSNNMVMINKDDPLYLSAVDLLDLTIRGLNHFRNKFIETGNKDNWWQMIQLLPQSYNQRSTVMLNYQVLRNMYHSRKNHKLDEWKTFCEWIESLPYAELITE